MKKIIILAVAAQLLIGCNSEYQTTVVATPCPPSLIDARDGEVYETVQIGDQCWMNDTMRVGKLKALNASNNTHIDEDEFLPTDDGVIEKYCFFPTLEECRDGIGFFYTWEEAMEYSTKEGAQGICPDGWHIPSEEDWNLLEDEIEKQQNFTPEKNLSTYFDSGFGFNWEWTSTGNTNSVRVYKTAGATRGDRLGSTVKENKYNVRCVED